MNKLQLTCLLLFLFVFGLQAQINFTANDQVPEYNGTFRLGVNPGYHGPAWDDMDLANISGGNSALGLGGAGIEAFRASLPEHFLEQWGYEVQVPDFQHYLSVGLDEHVTFIGYPSNDHQDMTYHCPDYQSEVFANLYLDIWDGGANGTPVNDDNYYALYVYRMVTIYQDYVRFWEIWNEPDFDFSGNGSSEAGEPGNWFENIPEPCDIAIRAPVFDYIRMLRISYEVIKSVDPDAYIAIGGIGYESFLDVVLRHTDNPAGGQVSADYPNYGGAYFDVLSFHSYPHIDGSLRYWDNDVGGFVYTRHSDAAVDGMVEKQSEMYAVLNNYGYNDLLYPKKLWLVTEANIPAIAFDDHIGSEEAQRNYIIKTRMACEFNDILQFDLYALARKKSPAESEDGFDAMGFYHRISDIGPYDQVITDEGIAARTMTGLLSETTFDPTQTAALQLPENIRGAAYLHPDDSYTFVLWAVTQTDQSEVATANYSIPASFNVTNLQKREWDFSVTNVVNNVEPFNIALTGAPIFLRDGDFVGVAENDLETNIQLFPNPVDDHFYLSINENATSDFEVTVFNVLGGLLYQKNISHPGGEQRYYFDAKDWNTGAFYLEIKNDEGLVLKKIILER